MEHWAKSLLVRFWKDCLLAELQAKTARGCRFLLFQHHSYEVTLTLLYIDASIFNTLVTRCIFSIKVESYYNISSVCVLLTFPSNSSLAELKKKFIGLETWTGAHFNVRSHQSQSCEVAMLIKVKKKWQNTFSSSHICKNIKTIKQTSWKFYNRFNFCFSNTLLGFDQKTPWILWIYIIYLYQVPLIKSIFQAWCCVFIYSVEVPVDLVHVKDNYQDDKWHLAAANYLSDRFTKPQISSNCYFYKTM